MKTLPAVVDENGDINLHGRQGAIITIPFTDGAGVARNVSAINMVWECGPGVNIPLTNHPTDNDKKILTLTNAEVKAIYAERNREFVLLDPSPGQPTPLWMGTVHINGWVE